MGGLYYKKWDQDNSLVVVDLFGPGVDFGNFVFFNTENKSLFGEATHYFNDKWSGTAGARVFEEEKHDPFIQTVGDVVIDESDLESSEDDVLPKLALAYDANEHLKLYLIGAEGYRAGGVNPIASTNPDAPPTFDEDTQPQLRARPEVGHLDREGGLQRRPLPRRLGGHADQRHARQLGAGLHHQRR